MIEGNKKLAILPQAIAFALTQGTRAGHYIADHIERSTSEINSRGGSIKKGGRTKWPRTNKI